MSSALQTTDSSFDIRALCGDVSAINPIADEWRALCEEGVSNQPFFRPEWFEAFLRAFEPRAKLRLVTARRAGRLRAVLPLLEERAIVCGLPVRRLRSPTNIHSNRFDVTVGAGDSQEALASLWKALRDDASWDLLEFQDVALEGQARHVLTLAAADRFPTGVWHSMNTPYVSFEDKQGDLESVLGKSGSSHFTHLRKKSRRLEKTGPVKLERVHSFSAEILAHFYELEAASWKGRAGTSISDDINVRRFYDLIAEAAAANGYLDIRVLRCGDEIAAMNYSFSLDHKHLIPKTTYAEKFSQCSPGQLIMRDVLQSCLDDKVDEFDFLGPMAPWKAHWTSQARPHHHCFVFRKSFYGQLLRFLRIPVLSAARSSKREVTRRWKHFRERTNETAKKTP